MKKLTTFKIEKTFNIIIWSMLLFLIVGIAASYITTSNLSNSSPSDFIGVKVGDNPKVVKVIVQSSPLQNQDSIKNWVKISTNHFFNYNINNFKDVLKSGRVFLTADFYNRFLIPRAEKNIEVFNAGYQISSSIVVEEPYLISKANINGVRYYRYFVQTSTVYKGEIRTVNDRHEITVTVKIEDPKENPNGIAIDEMIIR